MLSIPVVVTLLYTCTRLYHTVPSYRSFRSDTVHGSQTAWWRILQLLAASSQLASGEKTTDSAIKKKSQHFWGEAETNAMLDILREIDIMKF